MIIITRKELEELSDNSKLFKECIMPYSDGKYIIDDDLVNLFQRINDLSKQINYNNTIKLLIRNTNLPFDQDNLIQLIQDRDQLFQQALQIARDKRYFIIIILDIFIVVIFFQDDDTELIVKFNKFDYKLSIPFCLNLSDKGFEVSNLEIRNIIINESE